MKVIHKRYLALTMI